MGSPLEARRLAMSIRFFVSRPSALAAAVAVSCGAGALAQDEIPAQPPQAAQAPSLDEITVTGTRIRRDDFSSPTPTTVLDNSFLSNLGIVNVGDAMRQMPQNVNSTSPTTGA